MVVWNVESGQEKATLQGHMGSVNSVAFSPDGTTLASGTLEGTVVVWDVASGREKATLQGQGHTNRVYSVAFSPDGTTLASGGSDGRVVLWDVARGEAKAALQGGHTGWVNSVVFSPDGTALASGGHDSTVVLWDVASGQKNATLHGHTGSVRSVVFFAGWDHLGQCELGCQGCVVGPVKRAGDFHSPSAYGGSFFRGVFAGWDHPGQWEFGPDGSVVGTGRPTSRPHRCLPPTRRPSPARKWKPRSWATRWRA